MNLRNLGFVMAAVSVVACCAAVSVSCVQNTYYGRPPSHARVAHDEIKLSAKINFARNSSEIEQSSMEVIDDIAAVMNENPDINFVEIAGHASKEGNAQHNTILTQKRANAVMEALAERGVARDRMRAVGYGYYCELSAGDHEGNRRVEVKILRRGGNNTGVESGGCEAADAQGLTAQPIPATAPRTESPPQPGNQRGNRR